MSGILYSSDNRFYMETGAGIDDYDAQMIQKYRENIDSINSRREWKTSGAGARFMGAYNPVGGSGGGSQSARINGVAIWGDELVYSATLGDVGGIYRKPLRKDAAEGHILASNETKIFRISVAGDKCAASIGSTMERHIADFDLETGQYRLLTEGDVVEDYPCYARDGSKIYFSAAGLAISPEGQPMGVGPPAILCYHHRDNDIEELYAAEQYDYIAPKEDRNGDLLFIKRPYRGAGERGFAWKDLFLFPLRIVRAIGGLLNFFSVAFGGEPLHSGQSGLNTKAKQQSESDLFIEGNVVNAEQVLKENQRTGEQYPGIIPRSWELVRANRNGDMVCVKKGVMDYALCENGDIVYSNGNAVIRIGADGSEALIEKCHLATQLVEIV